MTSGQRFSAYVTLALGGTFLAFGAVLVHIDKPGAIAPWLVQLGGMIMIVLEMVYLEMIYANLPFSCTHRNGCKRDIPLRSPQDGVVPGSALGAGPLLQREVYPRRSALAGTGPPRTMEEIIMEQYSEVHTLAVFFSKADRGWIAIELDPDNQANQPVLIEPEEVVPKYAGVSAFGDSMEEAVHELSVALSLRYTDQDQTE